VASWKHWFRKNSPAIKDESAEIYSDVKEALRRQQIDGAGANNFDLRARGAAVVLQAIASTPNAMVRLGDVIIAKAKINGQDRLMIETLSPRLARELDQRPSIAADAVAFFAFIDAETSKAAIEKATQLDALSEPQARPGDKLLP
jgi:hypothetical protein